MARRTNAPDDGRRARRAALALLLAAACRPDVVEDQLAGLAVAVDQESGALAIAVDGRRLLDLDARDVGVKDGDATYRMEFGMFAIGEDEAPYRRAARMRVVAQAPTRGLAASLEDADGVALATVRVEAFAKNHVLVEVRALDAAHDRVRVGVACADDDRFVGLGAQTHDVDHRGQVVPLWVSEQGIGKTADDELPELWQVVGRRHTTHVPMPVVTTSRGTALLVDTPAFARFDLCATEPDVAAFEVFEDTLRLHVFAGDDPLDALARMTRVRGRPPMPPPWVFAPWNDAIFGSDAVREMKDFLRANDIPSSAIWFEDWRGGADSGATYRLDEDWRADPVLYPDFADLNAELLAAGISPLVYFNTFVKEGADVEDELLAIDGLIDDAEGAPLRFDGADAAFAPTALVDLTDDDAVAFVKGELKAALAAGARGWMADFAEWMPVEGAVLASGEDPALVHNRYPVLWQQTNVAAVEEAGLQDDVAIFYRSGHVGSPPIASIIWAGDQRTSFDADDGLPSVIPIGLGLAASGFFLFTHDVAGYQSSTNPPVTKELFFRWTSLGAFTPIMRTHHGTHARANWNLRSDPDSTAHWKRWAEVHVRLFPYLQGLARGFVDQGRPVWIPSGLLFPDDAAQWAVKDQFFLGDALLVAPVVEEGATARAVVFPGDRFVPLFAGGDAIEGPDTVEVDAPLDDIPVFLRAGGIVPLTATPADTLRADVDGVDDLASTEGDRVVYVGLGRSGRFVEESGATYVLDGEGTDDAGDEVVVDGDGVIEGDGFTFTLSGHPDGRATTVIFR